jgi:FKBP-type peptidyl-prolyl cis-trans isomerase (trigger factor)
VRLGEQGIGYDEYLKATERDEAAVRSEFRPDAEKRVKTLLVLSAIADKEQIEVPDEELEAELARSRERYAGNPRLLEYLDSPRGRSYTRSLLRRSQTVETLIDRWIAEHPEFSNVQHVHEDASSGGEGTTARPTADRPTSTGGQSPRQASRSVSSTIRPKKGKR